MNELVDLGALHPQLAHLDRPADGFSPGFCRAVSARFGIDPLLIRVLFILTSALSGVGVIAYVWGILLTPRAGRQAPIHRLLPVFSSWSLRTQWTTIVLSCILVVASVAQMAAMSPVLLLLVFALVLYRLRRGPLKRPAPPLPSQERSATETDPPLPVVDLYAPEEPPPPEPLPPERVRCSWLGTALVFIVGYLASTSVVLLGLLSNPLLCASIVLGVIGIMLLLWGLLVRSSRLPAVVLLLTIALACVTATLATGEAENTADPIVAGPGQQRLDYQFVAADDGVVDLRQLPADSSDVIHVRSVMSEVRIMLPKAPAHLRIRTWAAKVAWPGDSVPANHDPEAEGIQLVIDGYLSDVDVEYPT